MRHLLLFCSLWRIAIISFYNITTVCCTILLQFVLLFVYNLSLQVLCLIIITTGIPVERNYGRNPQASRNVWQRQHYHLPPLASFFYVVFRFLCTIFTWYPSLYTAMFFSGAPATSLLFAHSLLLFFAQIPKVTFYFRETGAPLQLEHTLRKSYFFVLPLLFQGHRQHPCYWHTLCGNPAVGCECKHDDANYAGLESLVYFRIYMCVR
jgi:hypothetical protein